MDTLLAPGVALLDRLRYPQKFALVSALLVLPLALAIGLLLSETLPRLGFTQRELAGLRYIRRLGELADMVGRGDSSRHDPALARAIEALGDDREAEALFLTAGRRPTLQMLERRMAAAAAARDQAAYQAAQAAAVGVIRDEIGRVGDDSNLILDPELTPYYLMDQVVVQLPARLTILAAVGSPASDPAELAGQLDANIASTRKGMEVAMRSDPALRGPLDSPLAASETRARALAASLRLGARADGPALRGVAGESMALWRAAAGELGARLAARAAGIQEKNALAAGAAALLLLLASYLLVAFYAATMRSVTALDRASQQLMGGGAVAVRSRDELGQVVGSFNRVSAALAAERAERERAERERAELQEAIIAAQASALDRLAAPIIPLGGRTILLPLVGGIDARRAQRILESALRGVADHRARTLVLDMTGVPAVDPHVARAIVGAASGTRLLGADVVLAGVRAGVARELAAYAEELGDIRCYGALQDALRPGGAAAGDDAV